MILISDFGNSKCFPLLNCVVVCPVGFVVNKRKDKRFSSFRVHQVKQINL